MDIKLDEDLPGSAVSVLAEAGHDVVTVYDQSLQGADDGDVIAAVSAEARVLITLDLGFGDIRSYPPDAHHGIIVLRLDRSDREHVNGVMRRLAPTLVEPEVSGKLWIVEEERVRIRG